MGSLGDSVATLPSTIGNYSIERELGRGGMGAVYVGVHQLIGKRAAIKVLLPQVSQRPDLLQRFFNEARAATAIHHPNIVDVHDYGIGDDGNAYLVMEYLDGESLAARMRSHGRLAVPQAVAIARQIALALGAAHRAGIVHRDLKPDNVFLITDPDSGSDRIKLLDFGVAKLIDDAGTAGPATVTGAILGTPAYMSPEQCEGSRVVDHRSDLYSLGCTLFVMLAGRLPFVETGIGGLIGAHLHTPAPPLRDHCATASPALAAIVDRLLAKAPDQRFQSAEELATALAGQEVSLALRPAAIPDTPIAAPDHQQTAVTESPARQLRSEPTAKSHRRARWPFVVAGVLAVAGIAIAAFVITRNNPAVVADKVDAVAARPVDKPIDNNPVENKPGAKPPVVVDNKPVDKPPAPVDPLPAESLPADAVDVTSDGALRLALARSAARKADYATAADELKQIYKSKPDLATRAEADKLKAELAPQAIAGAVKRIAKLRDAGNCQTAKEDARKTAATWGASKDLDRATTPCKSGFGDFDAPPSAPAVDDDSEVAAILALYRARRFGPAVARCMLHPPDRAELYVPCMVSACHLKRPRVAVNWMRRRAPNAKEGNQIVNALNECQTLGVTLTDTAKQMLDEDAAKKAPPGN